MSDRTQTQAQANPTAPATTVDAGARRGVETFAPEGVTGVGATRLGFKRCASRAEAARMTAVLIMLIAACGGGSSPTPQAIDVTEASYFVRDVYELDRARVSGDGNAGANAVITLADGIGGLLPGGNIVLPTGRSSGAAATGCTCTTSGCTFPHCGEGNQTLDGGITVSGTAYTFDVDYTATYTDNTETWHLSGNLTIDPAQLDGAITRDVSWTDGSTSTSSAEFRAVIVDAAHCAIGGVLHGDNAEAVPNDRAQTFHVAGDATFTPTCAISP